MMNNIFSEQNLRNDMSPNNTLHDVLQLGLMGGMWSFGTMLTYIKTNPLIIYLVELNTVNDLIFHMLQYSSFILTMAVAVVNLRKGLIEWNKERKTKQRNKTKKKDEDS